VIQAKLPLKKQTCQVLKTWQVFNINQVFYLRILLQILHRFPYIVACFGSPGSSENVVESFQVSCPSHQASGEATS